MQARNTNQPYHFLTFIWLGSCSICSISIAFCKTELTKFKYVLFSNQNAAQLRFSLVKFCTMIIPEMFWNVR